MDVPPKTAVVEGPESSGSPSHAPTQIEHDESVGQSAHLKNDLPRVVFAKVAALDAFLHRLGHQVSGRGAASFEVSRIPASSLARLEEHELEESWVLKCVVQVNLCQLCEPL